MNEIKSGLRAVLNVPKIYDFFQSLMGGDGPAGLVAEFIRPNNGDHILDLGCGTSRILEYLPQVFYYGFDSDEKYIEYAQNKYGNRGVFKVGYVQDAENEKLSKFDIVVMVGVLHHLDDESINKVFNTIFGVLKPGGRLITMDPTYIERQNPIAKFLISLDRGRNVRTPAEYKSLTDLYFNNPILTIKNNSPIPYTHCIIESYKN